MWVFIFGHLLISSNYDDNEEKITGGRNGYGVKLANIFSTEFTIETANGSIGKKYTQVFKDNMQKIENLTSNLIQKKWNT
jgi:DNA topoisomerase II